MKFRRIIILGNGVRTKPIGTAARVISMILINAVTLNAQVASPGHAAGPEAPVIPQQHDRITPLLGPLADQACLSGDLIFAVRAQAQQRPYCGRMTASGVAPSIAARFNP